METASNPSRKYRWITAACLTGMLLGSGIGTWVPAGSGWDFANFYDAGRRFAAGEIENLYAPESPIRGEPPQGHMAYWSPPLSAAFLVPLSGLSGETALILFKLQNTLALFATFALLYFFNRRFVRDDPVARWEFAALFSFPLCFSQCGFNVLVLQQLICRLRWMLIPSLTCGFSRAELLRGQQFQYEHPLLIR